MTNIGFVRNMFIHKTRHPSIGLRQRPTPTLLPHLAESTFGSFHDHTHIRSSAQKIPLVRLSSSTRFINLPRLIFLATNHKVNILVSLQHRIHQFKCKFGVFFVFVVLPVVMDNRPTNSTKSLAALRSISWSVFRAIMECHRDHNRLSPWNQALQIPWWE